MGSDFEQPNVTRAFWWALSFALLLWLAVANIVYAFRHPELTSTQRFLHFFDVMLFR